MFVAFPNWYATLQRLLLALFLMLVALIFQRCVRYRSKDRALAQCVDWALSWQCDPRPAVRHVQHRAWCRSMRV